MSEAEICQLAYSGNIDQLKVRLREKNDFATKPDESGRQAIHWGASGCRTDVVEYLLNQFDINHDTRDDSNWTPLMIAASAGGEQIVRNLLARDAQVNCVNSTGQCPLHYAASKDRYEIAEILLQSGADVNIADKVNHTPLHRAASKGHAKMTKLLLSYSADPNHQDSQGDSPLHMACEDEQSDVAKMLVEHGASITVRNKNEKTPLGLAPPGLKRQLERLSNEIPT